MRTPSINRQVTTILTVLVTSIFIVSYLWTRFSLIESDLAPFDVTQYSPIDAFYYSMMAFDWFQGGTEPAALANYAPLPSSLLLNAMVYPNLVLLGNNFAGMRANVVVISLATSLIFSFLVYKRFGTLSLLLSSCIYLISTSWIMASLVVEPTIYRLFHFSLLLVSFYLVEKRGGLHSTYGILLLSGLAFVGPTFVYPTNLFSLISVMFIYTLEAIRVRSWSLVLRFALWSSIAGFSIFGLWLTAIYLSLGGIDPVLNYFSVFGARVAGGASMSLLDQVTANFWAIRQFLLFDQVPYSFEAFIAGLLVAGVSFATTVFRAIRGMAEIGRAQFDRTTLVFLLLFFSQTLFVNDYPVRKLVFLLPFVLFLFPFLIHKFVPWGLGRSALVIATTLWLAVPSAQQSQQHLFHKNETTMKQAMMSMNELGPLQVGGGFSHGFRLYNRIRPFLSYYVYSYVLHDMATYNTAMANLLDGVVVCYSIQIEVDDTVMENMAELGFVLDRVILDSHQRGVGRVALFRWTGCKATDL